MHQNLDKPATLAIEISKKRTRPSTERHGSHSFTTRDVELEIQVNDVNPQYSFPDLSCLSFPTIEWVSEDEDERHDSCSVESDVTKRKNSVSILIDNILPTTKTAWTVATDINNTELNLNQDFESLEIDNDWISTFPLKKRKTNASETPRMVRSIGLRSHLSELASSRWHLCKN